MNVAAPAPAYGDYRIVQVLGRGGMGVVYEAEHPALGRRVALKVLLDPTSADPVALGRLRREALSMGALQHPHVVQVSDFSEGPPPFLVMELLRGQCLRDRLSTRGPMRVADACLVVLQLLSALGAAHRAGIVHRDVKPANVFVVETPLTDVYVKLLDFGVAKLLTPQSGPALTEVDTTIGSAPYMAPEQIRGEAVDGRTDIFAVGVTLYELLAGRRPFEGTVKQSVMSAILRGGPIAPLGAAAPSELEAIILRALQGSPAARHATAEELAAALLPFVPQASLGAVATSVMESRNASAAAAPAAPAAPAETRSIGGTTNTSPPPGPPTFGPPTLTTTVDQTAGLDPRRISHGPPPLAPTWTPARPVGYSGSSPPMGMFASGRRLRRGSARQPEGCRGFRGCGCRSAPAASRSRSRWSSAWLGSGRSRRPALPSSAPARSGEPARDRSAESPCSATSTAPERSPSSGPPAPRSGAHGATDPAPTRAWPSAVSRPGSRPGSAPRARRRVLRTRPP